VLDGVITIALDHHVRDRLSGPSIPRDKFSDDVEEAWSTLSELER
jgi:hypothetical protein